MPSPKRLLLLFLGLFLLRLFFGLCEAKWWELDETQTYLIGLKFFTTGGWPWFGPDLNGAENSFQSQIPGALEGLVIGLPFHLLPIPEAPFIFLNLMSTAGAALLTWYIYKRIPSLSFPLLFLWISVTPWTLHKAAHIINPAFNFLPSVLFFLGFMETMPRFSMGLLRPALCNALMGFSLFWIMQFHFSYVWLAPLGLLSLFLQIKNDKNAVPLLYFLLGALPMLVLIIPTFVKYGLARGDVAAGFTVPFNRVNVGEWLTLLARYFSLVCFELPRFIGTTTVERIAFLRTHALLLVPGALLWIAGLLQPFVMLFAWFKRRHPVPAWRETKWFILLAYLMIWVSFWFTVKLPLSHIYFVFYPWLMLYSCYCWSLFAGRSWGPLTAKVFLALALYFQMGYALVVAPSDSFYGQGRREKVVKAIEQKDYRLVSERRAGSLY